MNIKSVLPFTGASVYSINSKTTSPLSRNQEQQKNNNKKPYSTECPRLPFYTSSFGNVYFGALNRPKQRGEKCSHEDWQKAAADVTTKAREVADEKRAAIFEECKNGDLPSPEAKNEYLLSVADLTMSKLWLRGEVLTDHTIDVADYMESFVQHLSKDPDFIDANFVPGRSDLCAKQHDLGKLFISTEILEKVGRLTDEEFTLLNNHPIKGVAKVLEIEEQVARQIHEDGKKIQEIYNIPKERLQAIEDDIISSSDRFFNVVIPTVLLHHSHYDGGPGGYVSSLDYEIPQNIINKLKDKDMPLDRWLLGKEDLAEEDIVKNRQRVMLKERSIPLRARILSIVDAYDAMTADRGYNSDRVKTPAQACEELRRCAKTRAEEPKGGGQFDPVLVEKFVDFLHEKHPEKF